MTNVTLTKFYADPQRVSSTLFCVPTGWVKHDHLIVSVLNFIELALTDIRTSTSLA